MGDNVIGRAVLEITVDDKQYTLALDRVAKSSRDAAKEVNKLFNFEVLKTAGTMFMSFAETAAKALVAVGSGIVELGERGAAVGDVSEAFDQLSARVGATGDAMRTSLREGVKGTVTDFELMQLANKALGAGLVRSEADMRTLSEGAFMLANRTGGDAKEAFERLTSVIASGKVAQLKQFGIFVDNKVAAENYAKSIGKSAGDLTKMEQATALSQATMAKLRAELAATGPTTADFGEKIQAARVQWENFKDRLGQAIATSGPLNAALSQIGVELSRAFGPNQKGLINAVVGAIEGVVIGTAVLVGWTADGVKLMVGLWTSFRTTIQGVATFFWQTVATLATKLAELADRASALPIVGKQFEAVASGLNSVASAASTAAANSEKTSEMYTQMGNTVSAAAGGVSAAAARIVIAMREADDGTKRATETNKRFGAVIGDPAPVARAITADQAIAESRRKLAAELDGLGKSGLEKKIAVINGEFDAEVARISSLKGIRAAEMAEQITLAESVRDQKLALAVAEGDATKQRTLALQQELLLMQQTGIQQELLQLEFKKQAELAAIETLRVTNIAAYTEQATLIGLKYQEMTAAAQGHYASVQQAAAAAGFKTRAEQQAIAANAAATYAQMKKSGLFTEAELLAAKQKSTDAAVALNDTKTKAMMIADSSWANASVELLSMLGGKFKAAAIAAVIINTAQAVMKTWANLGFPAAIPGSVVAIAAGAMQIAKIKGQKSGYKEGTPGLDFSNFGAVTPTNLHGQEAVIPRGKGHMLAGEIAGSMPDNAAILERIAGGIESLPLMMKRAVRDGLLLANG